MQSLRNSVSSTGHFSEGFLDFLFFMIDHFSWRPDYIPHTGKGLAQINLEAPRVLAHAYLFDIDTFLERVTGGNFTRWMDDIDFGIDDEYKAKKILQELDEILLSKGLHLNSSKTKILNSFQANEHFHFSENALLNVLSNNIDLAFKRKKIYTSKIKKIKNRYSKFKNKNIGNADKIIKRYIGLFAKFKCGSLDKELNTLLLENTALRQNVFRYLNVVGWTQHRQKVIENFISKSLDDEGLLQSIRLLISWSVPYSTQYRKAMVELADSLYNTSTADDQCRLLCSLWLHCKFSHPHNLSKFVIKSAPNWRTKPWLARQFAAVWPLLDFATRNTMKNIIYINGLTNARSVVDNMERIEAPDKFIVNNIMPYISAFSTNGTYPLHKALIARSFVHGSAPRASKDAFVQNTLRKIDDIHLKILIRISI